MSTWQSITSSQTDPAIGSTQLQLMFTEDEHANDLINENYGNNTAIILPNLHWDEQY